MRFFTSLALFALSAGFVTAQTTSAAAVAPSTTSTSGYTCAAQDILDACLATENPQLSDCQPNDWKCMCEQSTNVLTCYNNCPSDPDRFGAQQQMTSYCNAAKDFAGTSTSVAAAAQTTAASSDSSLSSPSLSKSGSSSSTASSTSSGSSATASHGAAAGLVVEAGSLLAAVFMGFFVAL